jgi:hypothetical protein
VSAGTDQLDARLGSSHNASLVHYQWVKSWAERGVKAEDLKGPFAPPPVPMRERVLRAEQTVLEAWARKQAALKAAEALSAAERVRAKVKALKKARHRACTSR